MTNYLGWINSSRANQDESQCAHNKLAALGLKSKDQKAENIKYYVSNVSNQPISVSEDEHFLAFIVGYPDWENSKYRDLAASDGAASALIFAYKDYHKKPTGILRGHYLAGIVNKADGTTHLYTDKLATIPVFYALDKNKSLIFSSDINLMRTISTLETSLSNQSVFNYLYFHVIPSPDTIYAGIHKLGPSQCLTYKNNSHSIETYWLPTFKENADSIDMLSNELKEKLNNAVSRCAPNNTTGAFLSGGLDSSTVCGYLSRQSKEPANCFSIGFDEPGYDEMEYARIAAKHFNLNLHEFYVTPDDVWEAMPKMTKAYAEPFGNSSAIPAYFCAQFAKQNGMHTLLAGDGGDELFAGNERYAKQKIFGIYDRIPGALKRSLIEPLLLDLPFTKWTPITRKVRSYIEQARTAMPERMESYNYMNRIDLSSMFDPSFQSTIDTHYPIELLSSTYDSIEQGTMLNKMLYLDWKFTLADNDLFKVNRMCEINGIQVRYPMLDDDLLEFSTRVPSNLKLKDLKLRYFYKKSLEGVLPHTIINKPKQGFGLPFGEWLKKSDKLQETIYDSLSDLKKRNIIKSSFLDELISTHKSEHAAYYGTMIWVLAMLEQWFQAHYDKP